MSYIRVLDEGAAIQDHCVEMNFVGAGVAATRPFTNDRVTVTVPGAADVSGWTRIGAGVFLTNIGDTVQIGAAAPLAAEKVRIVNAAGVALRLEGREDFPKTGTAAAAASQAPSYVIRLTASMWNAAGNAEVERDFDLYATPDILTDDETTARATLAIDYEGFRLLEVQPLVAAPAAVSAVRIISNAPLGGGAVPVFDLLARNALNPGDMLVGMGNDIAGGLFRRWTLYASGIVVMSNALWIGAGQVLTVQQPAIADVANGVDVGADNTLRTDVRALKAMLRTHGLMAP